MYFYVNTWPNTELLIPWSVIPKYHNYKFQRIHFHIPLGNVDYQYHVVA